MSFMEEGLTAGSQRRASIFLGLGGLSAALSSAPPALSAAWRASHIRSEALALSIHQGGPGDRDQYIRWLDPEYGYLATLDDMQDRAIALDLTQALRRVWSPAYPTRPDGARILQLLDGATPSLGSRRIRGGVEVALWYAEMIKRFDRPKGFKALGGGYHRLGIVVLDLLRMLRVSGFEPGLITQHLALLMPVLERQLIPGLFGSSPGARGPHPYPLPSPILGAGNTFFLHWPRIHGLPSGDMETSAWLNVWHSILETAVKDGLDRFRRVAMAHDAWQRVSDDTPAAAQKSQALFELFVEYPRLSSLAVSRKLGISKPQSWRRLSDMEKLLSGVQCGALRKGHGGRIRAKSVKSRKGKQKSPDQPHPNPPTPAVTEYLEMSSPPPRPAPKPQFSRGPSAGMTIWSVDDLI